MQQNVGAMWPPEACNLHSGSSPSPDRLKTNFVLTLV